MPQFLAVPQVHGARLANDMQPESTEERHRCGTGVPPVLLHAQDGHASGAATKSSWKNASGGYDSRTEWHRCVAWGSLSHFAAKLEKGLTYHHLSVSEHIHSRYLSEGIVQRRQLD